MATEVVKKAPLNACLTPHAPAASLSWAARGHHGSQTRGASRSPGKRKNKSSGRSKSPLADRIQSPHYCTVKVNQERENHPPGEGEDQQPQEDPSEQESRELLTVSESRTGALPTKGGGALMRGLSVGRVQTARVCRPGKKRGTFIMPGACAGREHRPQNEGPGGEAREVTVATSVVG